MKLRYIIFLLMAFSCLTFAQKKRYLVSPYQEVIPIDKSESAKSVFEARARAAERAQNSACSNQVYDGFTPDKFEFNSNFGAYHKDVMGEWFVSKYTGHIDTILWQQYISVGALESTLFLRVHRSNIGPNAGPGVRPGPYNPPCQNWGYWINTDDLDQGVAAFPDDATDTTWFSTIAGSTPSFRPFEEELWGLSGVPVAVHPSTIMSVPMDLLPPPGGATFPLEVNAGDVFFMSLRVNGPSTHPNPHDARTEFATSGFNSAPPEFQEYYPSRNWKFYEHDSGPSNCAGVPLEQVKRGWVARGGFEDDTLYVAGYLFWYAITTNDNTPPQLLSSNTINTTTSTDPQTVSASLEDCDPSNPGEAGIASVTISYSLNGEFAGTVPMTNVGGDLYEGEIPGQQPYTTVSYTIIAEDNKGLTQNFPQTSYRVVSLSNNFFTTEITDTCAALDIRNTGTEIPITAFFKHPEQDETVNPLDDGTAGPFSLGGTFSLHGQELNYAWVGVNGAISLTKTATDTLDVNSNGFYSTTFDFPGTVKPANDHRDTANTGRKPGNFIAPFWNDLIYADSVDGTQFGHILYEDRGCEFIVQWDSIAIFATGGTIISDEIKFRVILNKCDLTVTYQYDNVGLGGLDTTAIIGIQCDSIANMGNTAPWAFINRNAGPSESTPINGMCVRMTPTGAMYVNDKWNMLSVPNVPNGGYSVANLFPTATSSLFRFAGGYTTSDPLVNGTGYWGKFSGGQLLGKTGAPVTDLSVSLAQDWNMIGTISCAVSTSTIEEAIVSGASFFGFNNGYVAVTSLLPGKAYWVKSTAAGNIQLDCASASLAKSVDQNFAQLNGFSKLTIRDYSGGEQVLYVADGSALKVPVERFELPPVPPSEVFDARFASNRVVEAYSNEAGKIDEYTIKIQSSAYPVTLQWDATAKGKSLVVTDGEGKAVNTVLNGSGALRITNPSISSLKLKVVDEIGKPTVFALSQNYPNPFNPVTRFTVDVPNVSDVEISVFDILGRKIATLLTGQKESGTYTIEWDGKDYQGISSPTGMYFVRMVAGDFSEVRKIMLLK